MSNGKNGRKNLVKVLGGIIIIIIATVLRIDVSNIIPSEFNETQTSETAVQEVEGALMLHMIDVGQADSFLLVQNGKTALIDCGTRSSGEDVVKYLNDIGITKLDYVFGTHPHDDHMGGMYDVITNVEVDKVMLPNLENAEITSNWYMKLVQELKKGNYDTEIVKLEEIYSLGDASIKVIGPISEPKDNTNNYSIVLKVSFGEMDIIFTGDAETEVEEDILESGENIDAEILKLGHHGSDTSTSIEFLDAINPEYALISAGKGNKYEHPIKSTMEKLEERNIEVYRTDESGNVVATITSSDVSFSCEPGDYLSGVELEGRE